MDIPYTRRDFLYRSILATAGLAAGTNAAASINLDTVSEKPANFARDADDTKICIFSKHLQWLTYQEMAKTAAMLGFDGIDLTVRPNGHVEPERVAEDLPKAVKAVEQAGLKVYMLTTEITSADQPHTQAILKTAAKLGIKYYRMGWVKYEDKQSIEQNLEVFKKMFGQLAALNKQYQIHGAYQNHAGKNLGSAIWDLWMVIKDLDPQWLGCQYDIRHAIIEGANSWPLGLKLVQSHIRTLDIKDFRWENKDGKWQIENVPLGEGMVDFTQYFSLLRSYQIKGPFSLHYEYPLGGADSGAKSLAIPKEQVLEAMKKDLATLRKWVNKA
ncbi:sugar phosphate isomerase/epimerase family protein [Rhodocytophaga aerolata]|uniref:Sugar phosphate isomerase/epimerase family protein n=1 Tax=Rhodocytophaga aerolata TaxID=455078 RepID=A0ABT8R6N3_9BACT|nr:sugar phosphate isomerase/epimerase family protein [Rhodocytophaga aerolata]MDO1447766.1 sugar phosphate isomerase/epimerase family protein [Rhodocytophaga aerolata]